VVIASSSDALRLRITYAKPNGSRILSDKGINFPDTDLGVPFPTQRDRELLPFAARNADLIGMSFVQTPADVRALYRELRRLRAPDVGVVLKIETRRAFEQIPKLLLSAMGRRPLGVMIARGDLALESGYERMAEIQEELLWICEAAHVPVIWATAVLETLAKTGQPSRAEITDAAMSERAECVMLNKGPHILEAIRMLDDVLRRMERHQRKKTPALRPLGVSNSLFF
jgi:pyruvate kinase